MDRILTCPLRVCVLIFLHSDVCICTYIPMYGHRLFYDLCHYFLKLSCSSSYISLYIWKYGNKIQIVSGVLCVIHIFIFVCLSNRCGSQKVFNHNQSFSLCSFPCYSQRLTVSYILPQCW